MTDMFLDDLEWQACAAAGWPGLSENVDLARLANGEGGAGRGPARRRPTTEEWEELAAATAAGPYCRPAWFEAWWRAFGGTGTLDVHAVWCDQRVIALLPLINAHGNLVSPTNYHTPYFGMAANDRTAAIALADDILSNHPRRITLGPVDPDGLTMMAFRQAAAKAGYRVLVSPFQRSPYLDVEGDWNRYEARLSRKLLSDVRRKRSHLSSLGPISFEIGGADHQSDALDRQLCEAFGVEASGWKGRRGTAMSSQCNTIAFYTDVARWAVGTGAFRLFVLRLGGLPIAVNYALEEAGICHLLKGGYDPAYARFSPGLLLAQEIVRRAFAQGLSRVEFHGDAERYKVSWATGVHEMKRFEAFSPSLGGQLEWARVRGRALVVRALKGAVPVARTPRVEARVKDDFLELGPAPDAIGRQAFSIRHKLTAISLLSVEALDKLADTIPLAAERHAPGQPLVATNRPVDGQSMVLRNIEQAEPYRQLLDRILDEVVQW